MVEHEGHQGRTELGTSRRRLLASVAGLATTGLAGCSGVSEQSFEASKVVLPSPDQDELVLTETGTDSNTVTREFGDGSAEVSVTNHVAVYRRAPALEGS